MLSLDDIERVLAEVAALGLLAEPTSHLDPATPSSTGSATGVLAGTVGIGGQSVQLELYLPTTFPLALPVVFLRPWDALGVIPHVLPTDGVVCFADSEGLILNRRDPVGICAWALQRAVAVLSRGAARENWSDFVDEFESYWRRLPNPIVLDSMVNPGGEVRFVQIASKGTEEIAVFNTERELADFQNGEAVGGKFTLTNALYLPLQPGTVIVPPPPDSGIWTAAQAREALLPGVGAANAAPLRRALKKSTKSIETVVVSLPRPSGGETLFGLRFYGIAGGHPLSDAGTATRVAPILLRRRDRRYLVPRGGGNEALGERRVLLVGGGAVGGRVAVELARAGILDLTIVDSDGLVADNTFRHVLGRRFWGMKKAAALKVAIESELPYVRVRAVESTVQNALATRSVLLGEYDLVISTLGNPTVELEVNGLVRARVGRPRAIFAWVEPYGLGGHALLTGLSSDAGCFGCLYTDPGTGASVLTNRAAFAGADQFYGRALSGCGSLHTPYGSLDAARSATLAVQLALDALTERAPFGALRSWKGDATAFRDAGFTVALRHALSEEGLRRQEHAFATPGCRACGQTSSVAEVAPAETPAASGSGQ